MDSVGYHYSLNLSLFSCTLNVSLTAFRSWSMRMEWTTLKCVWLDIYHIRKELDLNQILRAEEYGST